MKEKKEKSKENNMEKYLYKRKRTKEIAVLDKVCIYIHVYMHETKENEHIDNTT